MLAAQSTRRNFLLRFRLLAYVLVALAIFGFSYAENNPAILVLGVVGLLVSWFWVERDGVREIPRWLINLGVLVASLLLFYELVILRQENLLRALGHFMVAILICKLFEKKHPRDYAQILTLTLLIMVAGAIFSQSMLFGVVLAAYLLTSLYMVLVYHLHQETLLASAADPRITPPSSTSAAETAYKRDVHRLAVYAVAGLMLIASVVFMLFPRGKAHDLLSSWAMGQTRTGFSDRVRFGDVGRVQLSDALVMEVKLEQNGINIGSEYYQPYFRGLTLDAYDPTERFWLRSPFVSHNELRSQARWFENFGTRRGGGDSPERTLTGGRTELVEPQTYNTLGMVTQTYTLHALSGNVLFSVSPPVVIRSEQFRTVNYAQRDQTLIVRGSIGLPVQYTVDSAVLYKPDLSNERAVVDPGDLGLPLAGSDSTPSRVPDEITRIARDVAKELAPPDGQPIDTANIRTAAERIDLWLKANYPYSLSFRRVDPNLDPTADFLVNRKSTGGHCEYFASAMVMMCRSLGINARMVTGYHGGEFNTLGGFYVVRQKHAHAWVEVFIPNRGWVLYDPTPPASEAASASTNSWFRWFQEMSEIVQKNWLSAVVSFDNTSRQVIIGTLSNFMESISRFFTSLFTDLNDGLRALFVSNSVSTTVRLTGIGAILTIVLGLFWLLKSIHRRKTSYVAHILRHVDRKLQRQLSADLVFFDELLRVLMRTGIRKSPEQTPREYVDTLAARLRDGQGDAHWLVKTFYDIRFGTVRSTPELQSRIQHALSRVRQHVQA